MCQMSFTVSLMMKVFNPFSFNEVHKASVMLYIFLNI